MKPKASDLDARLAVLKVEFARRCLADAERLTEVAGGNRDVPIEQGALGAMCEAMHRMAGTGGIFGYGYLSQCAGAFEDALRSGAGHRDIRAGAGNMARLIRQTFGEQASSEAAESNACHPENK